MKKIILLSLAAVVLLSIAIYGYCEEAEPEYKGYLEKPPVFIIDDIDVPLGILGGDVPNKGTRNWDAGSSSFESDEVRKNGVVSQHGLSIEQTNIRLGAQIGVLDSWAVRISVPWRFTSIGSNIGGLPANTSINGLADIDLLLRKTIWMQPTGEKLVASLGIEVPTGKDNALFDQSNDSTNAYYRNSSRRLPMGWQNGNGAFDGILALAYEKKKGNFSYVLVGAAKVHGKSDEDVKIGDIFITALNSTYGLSKEWSGSVGITYKQQKNDSYPNAPAPGVGQNALAGTTEHGSMVFMDLGIRYTQKDKSTFGFGYRIPISNPDNGFVPDAKWSLIFSPKF